MHSEISHCTSLQFLSAPFLTYSSTVAGFVHSENQRETQLKTWQQNGRYIVTQSRLAALNYLGQGGFCKPSDNGELCCRHRGWFSPFKWGHRIPAFSLCLVWGQTFFLKAFLNMSRGRNMTQGQWAQSSHSSKNIWIAQEFLLQYSFCLRSLFKSRLCPKDHRNHVQPCNLITVKVCWAVHRTLQMWRRRNLSNHKAMGLKHHFKPLVHFKNRLK